MGPRRIILRSAAREYVAHDARTLQEVTAQLAYQAGARLAASASNGRSARGYKLLMRLHSGSFSESVDRRLLRIIRKGLADERTGPSGGLTKLFRETSDTAARVFSAKPQSDPHRLIGSRILVIKAARPKERGVVVVDYTYVFPLMSSLFDLDAIAERYTIVLEPSWAGSCAPEVLLFGQLSQPVYVQTTEPRDRDLLTELDTNLRTIPIAANWWVDPRPQPPAAERDIDVIMVAAWADIKRHWRVFRTLAGLRRRGYRLKTVLIGYQYDRTMADIRRLADYFGIGDQVELFERISQNEVSALLARSKVHVLWSRRECANRAVVEAMLADTPVIVREGLTFGYRYPYINDLTGRFVAERDLADAIMTTIENRREFSPRAWILDHMTCHKATSILEQHLRDAAQRAGEPWTEGLVVKTSTLDTQRYLMSSDRQRFSADYEFIASHIRRTAHTVLAASSPAVA